MATSKNKNTKYRSGLEERFDKETKHKLASSTAFKDFITENFSSFSVVLFFLLMPAVSAKIYSFPLNSTLVSTESIVVPGISETIILSSLRIAFIDEDLPTFGFPII